MSAHLEVVAYGDAGLLVAVRHPEREQRWVTAQAIAAALARTPPPGLVDVVATYEDVFVAFDPLSTDHEAISDAIRGADLATDEPPAARTFTVPVLYGGEHGPDLADVADGLGLSASELVERHASAAWTVRFRGSPAATPFMDGPAWPRSVPRMRDPRTAVPPGSVALSGQQCAVYTVQSPGGWRLIGRTPLGFVDRTRDDLVPYRPGDVLRFVAVDRDRFDELADSLLEPDP
ncbi:MAG: carboxyltransferase protein [Nocardioidaceae bacterium]|nr:carboxyltransferase protein [Nocardioidaceae bacterium]